MTAPRHPLVRRHSDLEVYQLAFRLAMRLFELSKSFPPEERYSLTDQMRRSCRSVCANLAEAWRKRRYEAAFISKLGDAEAEAAETQTWIQFAVECKYVAPKVAREIYKDYDTVLGQLIQMITHANKWTIP
jgi:four helix bundle protein